MKDLCSHIQLLFHFFLSHTLRMKMSQNAMSRFATSARICQRHPIFLNSFKQKLWFFCFVYDESALKGICVENIKVAIRKSLQNWWAERQHASVEDITQKVESLNDLQAISTKTDKALGHEYGYRIEGRQFKDTRNSRNQLMNVENDATVSRSSMTQLFAAVEYGEFHLNDETSMEANSCCRFCMN